LIRLKIVSLAAAVLGLTGCAGSRTPSRPVSDAPATVVQTAEAGVRQWPDVYEATGTVRARASATLSSRLTAYVRQVAVQLGDHVNANQLLVTLDSQELESGVQRATAAEAEVLSAVPEADSAVQSAQANLDLARTTHQRVTQLAAKKSVSNQELDESSARLKVAEAALAMAQSKRRQLDSRLVQARQELHSANIMRDYTRIAAPFAGVVTAKPVEPGTLATPGAPLLTIEREGGYRLEASVDESKLPLVKAGQAVDVTLESLDRHFEARVSEIVPEVDAASRAYVVKIDLPALPNLRSGMFGRARFAMGTRKVLSVPSLAILERGQVQSVFVVEGGLAHLRLVTLGRRGAEDAEVLSGLTEGEKVIGRAPAGLVDGARVEPQP
jgi:multidrug efflux system membrane fusion protein